MNQQHKRFKSIFSTLLIVASICIVPSISANKVNNNISDPNVYINREIMQSRIQAAAHKFSIQHYDENLELNGEVYENMQIHTSDQIYNLSQYKKSSSCTYYKSNLQMKSLQSQKLDYDATQGIVSQDTQMMYVIGVRQQSEEDQKFLNIYSFNNSEFQHKMQVSFNSTNLDVSQGSNIFMVKYNGEILFTDGNSMYSLKESSYIKQKHQFLLVQGVNSNENSQQDQFLGISKTTFDNKTSLLMLYTNKINIYQYQPLSKKINIVTEIQSEVKIQNGQNTETLVFEDVQISADLHILALSSNSLYIFKLPNLNEPVKIQLDGQKCTRIYLSSKQSIHIICQYQKRNYIAQYFYNSQNDSLILNRYYNELQNYRLIQYMKNYIIMIGEDQIVIESNAVNRKVLLKMEKRAYSQRFVSFGLEKLIVLKKFQEQPFNQTIMAIGQNFMVLFKLVHVPSEVWCFVENPPIQTRQANILIVRNISTCQLNSRKPELQGVCMSLKPVQIHFQTYEIEKKITVIFVIVIVLLVFVISLLCLGCVFKANVNLNEVIAKIKTKIKKIKNKSKELKEI